jgi:hypothetical protein
MKHPWILPVLLLVAGCGDDLDTPEGAVKAQVGVMNDMADVFKTIKDKKSAEAAKPKLEALAKRAKEIESAMSKMEKEPSPADQQKMMADMMQATTNLMAAMQGIPQDPEIHQILDGIDMPR